MLMLCRRVCVTCAWFCTLKIPEMLSVKPSIFDVPSWGTQKVQIVEAVTAAVVVVVAGGGAGVVSLRFQHLRFL